MLGDLFLRKIALPDSKKYAIGLIAAHGDMCLNVARLVKAKGYDLVVLAIEPTSDALSIIADTYCEVNLTQGQKALDYLVENKLKFIVMSGNFPKKKLTQNNYKPDSLMSNTLNKITSGYGDDNLLKVVAALLKAKGMKVLPITLFMDKAVTPKGVLTHRRPTDSEYVDLKFGFSIAKSMGRLDVGQMVAVKNKTVLAVEAIEGTNETIKRIKELQIEGSAIIKVSKPQQDLTFDMPVIGTETIEEASKSSCTVIGVEARKTMIVDMDAAIALANKLNVTLVGL